MDAKEKAAKRWLEGTGLALIVYVLDQLSKWWLIALMEESGPVIEVTAFFNLVMAWNTGVSFSLFRDFGAKGHWPLTLITLLITLVLLRWQWKAGTRRITWPLGLIIGGAIGNITDRVRFGAVADFFDAHYAGYHWPAFNVADTAIVCGVILLIWDNLRHAWKEEYEEDADQTNAGNRES